MFQEEVDKDHNTLGGSLLLSPRPPPSYSSLASESTSPGMLLGRIVEQLDRTSIEVGV